MHFGNAILLIKDHQKRMGREKWGDTQWVYLHEGVISIHKNGAIFSWQPSQSDMLADDWVIVYPVNSMNFPKKDLENSN